MFRLERRFSLSAEHGPPALLQPWIISIFLAECEASPEHPWAVDLLKLAANKNKSWLKKQTYAIQNTKDQIWKRREHINKKTVLKQKRKQEKDNEQQNHKK